MKKTMDFKKVFGAIDIRKANIINDFAKEEKIALIRIDDFERTKVGYKYEVTTGILERELFKAINEKFSDKIDIDECVWRTEPFCHNKIKGRVRKHELWRVLDYEGKLIVKTMDSDEGVSVCKDMESKRLITCKDMNDIETALLIIISLIMLGGKTYGKEMN